jgi:hypothetical protein
MANSEIPSQKDERTNFWREALAWLFWTAATMAMMGGSIAFIAWIFWTQFIYGFER